jgi:hypothetical protein
MWCVSLKMASTFQSVSKQTTRNKSFGSDVKGSASWALAYLSPCKLLMLRTALKQPRILSERQKTKIIKSNNINLIKSIKKSIFISHPFWNICHVTSRKLRWPQCIMGDDLHVIYKQTNKYLEKIQWQCYPQASERACVISPLFGQGKIIFFFLMVICNSLLLLKSLPISVINCIKFYVNCSAEKLKKNL